MRRVYAELGGETDAAMKSAKWAGQPVDVDGQHGRIVGRTIVLVAIGTDRQRRQYAAYDIEVDVTVADA